MDGQALNNPITCPVF